MMCVDELHTMHLGVFQNYILVVIWHAIASNVSGIRGGLPEHPYIQLMVNRIRVEMTRWSHEQKRLNPGKPIYELKDFRASMIGTPDRPTLHAKAAESGSMLAFAVHFVRAHAPKMPRGAALLGAGEGLLTYMLVTRSNPCRMPPVARQAIADGFIRFLTLSDDAGVNWQPKQHLMTHLLKDMAFFGNPRFTGTWVGEGLNKQLAAVCRTAHAAVWSRRVISTMNHSAGPIAKAAASAAKRPRRHFGATTLKKKTTTVLVRIQIHSIGYTCSVVDNVRLGLLGQRTR